MPHVSDIALKYNCLNIFFPNYKSNVHGAILLVYTFSNSDKIACIFDNIKKSSN